MVLYEFLASEYIVLVPFQMNPLRRVSTILQLIHSIKHFYWVVNPEPLSAIKPRGTGKILLHSRVTFYNLNSPCIISSQMFYTLCNVQVSTQNFTILNIFHLVFIYVEWSVKNSVSYVNVIIDM